MVGLVMPVYNRYSYLKLCLDSLAKANFPDDLVFVMIDDHSVDAPTIELFDTFDIENIEIIKLRNSVNKGVNYCLKATITKCLSLGCDIIINLDSDTLVNPDFIATLLQLKLDHPKHIITGFHCRTIGLNGIERHPVTSVHENYCTKKSIGGVNMCFDVEQYRKYVSPALDKPPDWDYYTCLHVVRDGNCIVCSIPSVVQHIGMVSSLGHSTDSQPDVAYDFESDMNLKNKILIVNQTFGLGDIIWEQTLIKRLADKNNCKVVWPVEHQFVSGLNRAYPRFTFINKELLNIDYKVICKEYHADNDSVVVQLQHSMTLCRVSMHDNMKSKYIMYNMDWGDWKEHAMWERDTANEQVLFDELGLSDDEPYNLINKFFRSGNTGVAKIDVNNGVRNIEMKTMYGYSMFDWYKVIKNASSIHTVSTSIIYMLELMDLKTDAVDLYVRKPEEKDFKNIDYILQKHKYNLHM